MVVVTRGASVVKGGVGAGRRSVARQAERREETTGTGTSRRTDIIGKMKESACAACAAIAVTSSAFAPQAVAETRLPPLDTRDPTRCESAYVGNTLGMANGLSDKLLDLRFCDLQGADLKGISLPGALISDANFSKANMVEVVMSKAYAVGANFEGANLTNSVLDRVEFKNANLRGVNFVNAVITGIDWEGADVTDAVFEDALISVQDVKNLCANPTLKGDSRIDVGCKK
ncbi:putative chloroplast thylakoid lumenal protein [Chloropicon primus]|uniref:Putative chloroplast thylakoid lumenal protein n=1 Tax=Chloropicon primus TaxID=1764295 RepID=A0A5B8MBP9_9CHLO|nr:putative chloroplast thylakoid lumenal protein [Chloropicon primus]UPQ97111.1 putative chloroplast thylakoid lumenal protein [Chloropicon primus]|eukprot:QDZ17896.1 putative chloroplast thylakoid lumenal protein [Chloropicon primus]